MSHLYAVSQGDLTGWTHVTFNAVSSNVTVPGTIWEPGTFYQFLPTPQTLELVSSSADDSAAGIGARTVRILGLDANWAVQSEIVTMNGLTPVTTALTWWRINDMAVVSAGSTGNNVGTILLRRLGGGITQEYMAAGIGVARTAIYSVPANHDLLLNLVAIGNMALAPGSMRLLVESSRRDGVTGVIHRRVRLAVPDVGHTSYHHMADPAVLIREKTDYMWNVVAVGGGSPGGVSFYLSASIVNNTLHDHPTTTEHPRW